MRLEQALFEFKGRLHRLPFLGLSILNTVVSGGLVVAGALLMLRGKYSENILIEAFGVFTAFVMFFVFIWVGIALQVKRLHDMNCSGYYVIAWIFISGLFSALNVVVPGVKNIGNVINFIIGLVLIFTPGTPGSNNFDVGSSRVREAGRQYYRR